MVTDQEHPDFPNIFAQEKESNERSSSTKSANTLARMQLVAQVETLKYAVPIWLLMGRSGYWVKAYRPFTTAMEQSLREDTIKWQRERERRTRSGRSQGSYADMQARQERERRYPGEMDLDDDDYRQPVSRHRDARDPEPHPRDAPRPVAGGGRVPAVAVTTGYPPEPTYPTGSYTISSTREGYAPGQPAYYGSEREPRTAFAGGASTPPSINRSGQSGPYVQPGGYPSRTGPPVSAPISASYDPRRDVMGSYPSGYSESRSHRR
ncbi:hypothetical protein LTR40_009364 [Exophiala xenobiotica]|nr:hypothetical protein LTR40_009364 [Exophiala xenobiotica]